ncbi:27653_t:CDS:2, partial [Dentiscutata erythropus]
NREQLMLLVEKVIGMVAEVMKYLKVVQGERCCLRPWLCYHEYWENDVDIPKSKRKVNKKNKQKEKRNNDAADKKYLKVEFEYDVGQFVVRRKSMEKKIGDKREMFYVTAKLSIACGIHAEKGVLCDEFCCQNRFGHYWKSAKKTNSGGFREKKK